MFLQTSRLRKINTSPKTTSVKSGFHDNEKESFYKGAKENKQLGGDGVRDGVGIGGNTEQFKANRMNNVAKGFRYEINLKDLLAYESASTEHP